MLLTGVVTLEHRYRQTNEMLQALLESTGRFHVDITEAVHGLTSEVFSYYDVVLVNYDGRTMIVEDALRLGEATEQALFEFVSNGGGVTFYHSATWVDPKWPDEYRKMIGGWFSIEFGSRRNPTSDFAMTTCRDQYGITRFMPDGWLTVEDDLFAGIEWHPDANIEILATAFDDVKAYDIPNFPPAHHPGNIPGGKLENMPGVNTEMPVAWVNHYGKGRSFVTSIGHGDGTIKRAAFMSLFLRGLEWAATGKATLPPPDRSGDKRLRPWPYY